MSIHNKYFRGEIRKMFYGYPLLSEAMSDLKNVVAKQ